MTTRYITNGIELTNKEGYHYVVDSTGEKFTLVEDLDRGTVYDFGTYLPETVTNITELERLSMDVDMGSYINNNNRFILDGGSY